jgi:hypothetical protein
MTKILILILSSLLTWPAIAQTGTSVKQSGYVTPGHAAMWSTNGIIQDAGTAAQGFLTSLGVTGSGPAICQSSAQPSTSYNQICLDATSAGGGFTFYNYGTTPSVPTMNINGTIYPFPFTNPGGIVGPNSTTIGNVVTWANTSGTLVAAGGGGAISAIIDITQAPYNFSPSNSASTNATTLASALTALTNGGTIWIPPASSAYKVGCFTIPLLTAGSGSTSPTQAPFHITGGTVSSFGFSAAVNFSQPAAGAILDLRCNTTARIVTLGAGTLEIDHLTLINGNTGGGDTVPFILATNTVLLVHDNTIIGDTTLSGSNNIQDAIQLGGSSSAGVCNTAACSWTGYGTQIYRNWTDNIARFVYMEPSNAWTISALIIADNTIAYKAGSSSYAAIYCNGGTAGCDDNWVVGNLFDQQTSSAYPYDVDIELGYDNYFNNIFADNSPATALYKVTGTNWIQCETCGGFTVGSTAATLLAGDGTTTSLWQGPFEFASGKAYSKGNSSGVGGFQTNEYGAFAWSSSPDPTASVVGRCTMYEYGTPPVLTCDNGTYNDFMPFWLGPEYSQLPVQTKTSNYSISIGTGSASDQNTLFTNTGASGEVDFTLPASPPIGFPVRGYVDAAHAFKFVANTGQTINVNGTVSASAGNTACSSNGCSITLVYLKSNSWIAIAVVGTWTTT